MDTKILAFLVCAICALSFVLGMKYAEPIPTTHSVITYTVEAPVAIIPISSKPGKPAKPTKDTIIIHDTVYTREEDPVLWEAVQPYNTEYEIRDTSSNPIAYVYIKNEPLYRSGTIDSLFIYPLVAHRDSIPCPQIDDTFDFKMPLIYIGVGIITVLGLQRAF